MKKYLEDVKKRLKCWWDNQETGCGESHVYCRECELRVSGYSMQDAVKDAIGWIYRLEAATPKWISVEERLPPGANGMDFCALVLVCTREGCVTAGWNNDGKWHLINWDDDFISKHSDGFVTHWMPLPQAPEEET